MEQVFCENPVIFLALGNVTISLTGPFFFGSVSGKPESGKAKLPPDSGVLADEEGTPELQGSQSESDAEKINAGNERLLFDGALAQFNVTGSVT